MKRQRFVIALVVVAVLALAALLGACGSSSSSSSSSSSPAAGGFDVSQVKADPALTAMLPDNIKTAGQINCASDIPYPPWEMYVTAGGKEVTGFDYDLSQALGAKLGTKMAFNQTKFDSIILSIQGGKNDIVMSDMYDNAERQATLSFVDYAYDGTSILVNKGNAAGVSGLDSLAGKTVACERGTTQQKFLDKINKENTAAGKPTITVLALPDQPAALLAVKGGKAVGDMTDHSTAAYIAETTNDGKTFEVVADPANPNGYEPSVVGIGILKTNQQLVDTIQKALQALIDDGTYQKIIDKYGLLPVASAMVNQGTKPIPASSPAP